MATPELPPDITPPKLCHVIKWPDYDGYGFNLHTEKSKQGQFIGKIDRGSPADYAALKEGDRIIEVNGINVSNENHRQVVERIKAVPNETKLLVLEPATDRWYKSKKMIVKGNFPNIKTYRTPFPRPSDAAQSTKTPSPTSSPHIPSNAPAPRLCHLVKWQDFDGYGFNLHADKNKKIQYIGIVDENSPAEHAGLRQGDTIIEVNGASVTNDMHKQIVEKIKAVPNETKLLVVDDGTALWYKEHGITIDGTLPNIIYIKNPDHQPKNTSSKTASAAKPPSPKQNGTTKQEEDLSSSRRGSGNVEMTRKAPVLRICHLLKWPSFDGYGFNLHVDKQKRGHYIGKVDPGGPADLGGLKEYDRIVEVNGVNVNDQNHKQIIERIKANPEEVELMVVDEYTDAWYKSKNLIPDNRQANVTHIFTPAARPGSPNGQEKDNLSRSSTPLLSPGTPEVTSRRSPQPATRRSPAPQKHHQAGPPKDSPRFTREPTPPLSSERRSNGTRSSPATSSSSRSSPRDSPESPIYATPIKSMTAPREKHSGQPVDGLLNMSAAEMRQILTARKKKDPREIQMDLRQKYKIIEQM